MNKKHRGLRALSIILLLLIISPLLMGAAFGQSGTLTVKVKNDMLKPIENANIYIDGSFAGTTNEIGELIIKNFPSGSHNVTATKEGFENKTFTRDLVSGTLINFELKLAKDGSSADAVTFEVLEDKVSRSKIAEAAVYVDGTYTGKTNRHEGKFSTVLSAGEHEIRISKEGLEDNVSIIDIVPGTTYTFLMKPGGKTFSIFDTELLLKSLQKLIWLGAVTTIKLSVMAYGLGIVIGLFMGIGRTSKNKLIRLASSIYVEGVRGIPILLQLFIVYFGIPFLVQDITGGNFNIDAFTSCMVALSINAGAYIAEIFKAGIEAIHKGQMEAARSIGMTYNQSMRYIILPQAFKIVLPALGNEFIALIKDSSIGMVIAVNEITWWSKTLGAEAFNTFTPLMGAGIVYLCITIPLGKLVQYLEKRGNISSGKEGTAANKKKRKERGKPEATI
ncbi:glutamate ABC transporter permease [Methanocella sp. CWC-04]|uniref:Glutamate ABC transporter permease n=1 Tax=Methanooceanicella nereidis TaxID=2052831 RepID=A0AAP2W764_9EURY|nr:ABC transporter permease subunit [Methanocella sp. CWC-04]MCD1296083.1 glutamate ABC transporter permease [Methanocella sp. CWC-04]